MKNKIISVLFLLGLLLNACSPKAASSANGSPSEPAADSNTPSDGTMPVASKSASTAREAVLSEIKNTVSAKATSNDALTPATQGMSIYLGGVVETGVDGKARLDLLPEGTIVRVGPNSSFSLPELTLDENGKPKTTIELLFGKIFVLLNGGSLNVSTPSGVATVQGSVIMVQYTPETKTLNAGCIEGHCTIQGENGEEIEIPEGEESFVEEGEEPTDPDPLDQEDLEEFIDEFSESELEEFFEEIPNPEDYPEEEATPEATEAPVATEDASATDEPAADDSGGGGGGSTDSGGG